MTDPSQPTTWFDPDTLGVHARIALTSRLRSAAEVLLPASGNRRGADHDPPDLAEQSAELLARLVSTAKASLADDVIWLVLTAIAGTYPTRGEVDDARRELELNNSVTSSLYLLETGLRHAEASGTLTTDIDVVVGRVIVDVDHSAKHDLHTGIQQVTRNLLPHWHDSHVVTLTAWTDQGSCLRRLTPQETRRILRWGLSGDARPQRLRSSRRIRAQRVATGMAKAAATGPSLLVPWRSVLVLAEVPPIGTSDKVAAIGAKSGNRVVGIAYDAIPIASAEAVPLADAGKFGLYLEALKFASRMAGISRAAAAEIEGFVTSLPTQGLAGPQVFEVSLPAGGAAERVLPGTVAGDATAATPMVLVVGSHEPRKNHLAILHAAEMLWREGRDFALQFIGGSGWGDEFPHRVDALKAAGRDLHVHRAVDDATLQQAFADARFTMFPSLHEGYGLPVVESFAHHTPVITTAYGSTAEITRQGGALLVDPRDDSAILRAMRTLLTDDATLARLTTEIEMRSDRSWADYAEDLWATLVHPELANLAEDADRKIGS